LTASRANPSSHLGDDYRERREQIRKIQKERAERRHQMDLELIDRGATPEEVEALRQSRKLDELNRQMRLHDMQTPKRYPVYFSN
jgi:hypothetical protein